MSLWEQVGREVEDFIGHVRELPVSAAATPETVRKEIESRFDFAAPVPLSELTAQVAGLLRRHAVHVTHPRYFGLFNPSVSEAAIVASPGTHTNGCRFPWAPACFSAAIPTRSGARSTCRRRTCRLSPAGPSTPI